LIKSLFNSIASKINFYACLLKPKQLDTSTLQHFFVSYYTCSIFAQVLKTIFPDSSWQDGFFNRELIS